jgi:Cof subfamily protein (haloacid dehalogenase superfamily)
MDSEFPYRLAAIDLDETLLGADHSISTRNRIAVQSLVDRGVVCVIASGRMHEATIRYVHELELTGPVISYNGGMVRDLPSRELWLHERVPPDEAAEIAAFCAERGCHLNYYPDDRLYVADRGEWAELYVRQTGSPMEVVGDLGRFAGSLPTKLILIDTPEKTDDSLVHFQAWFGNRLYITKTNPNYLEFMNPSASKGAALELVAKRLGIAREAVIAFGDGHNDVPMLRWAGLGVAMGTGKEEAKRAADRIAPPFDEDGFGLAVEELLA